MADTKTIIEQAHSAFNKRDIDGALAPCNGAGKHNGVEHIASAEIAMFPISAIQAFADVCQQLSMAKHCT
jgi:hypothetical protein